MIHNSWDLTIRIPNIIATKYLYIYVKSAKRKVRQIKTKQTHNQ